MRKVGVVEGENDIRLDKKIEMYEGYLSGCLRDFQNIHDQRSLEAALQSPHARGVAQYSYVVDVLRDLLDSDEEGKYKSALEERAREAVSVLRDGNSPEWKRLAVATILEVLADVPV